MKEKPEIWGEIRKASSERMTKNNPSKNIINIEKGKYTRRLNGTLNTLEGHYGGNGRELTQPQILLASLLGWKTEINILTGIKKKKGIPQDFPSVYKIDIGNEKLKLAIEVDGQKHKLKKFLFRDLKKEIKLRSLGWKILRFTNEDVMNKTSQVLLQITKEVRAIRSSMI
jgi:very-short-patch-repair endonuclease